MMIISTLLFIGFNMVNPILSKYALGIGAGIKPAGAVPVIFLCYGTVLSLLLAESYMFNRHLIAERGSRSSAELS